MITGIEKPDSGEVKSRPPTAQLAYVDQSRDALEATRSLGGGFRRCRHPDRRALRDPVARLLGRFNFKGRTSRSWSARCPAASAAGCTSPKTLADRRQRAAVDEPSNDLDVETLRALEDALLDFAGSIMVISHDRWFLDRIATHILAAEGDSQWTFFDGNYRSTRPTSVAASARKPRGRTGCASSAEVR